MSFALSALSLYLRLIEKPYLARAKDPLAARERLERAASRIFRQPAGAEAEEEIREGVRTLRIRCGDPVPGRLILYLHGGAFLMGSPETHRHLAGALAREAGAIAVAPAYRLAPENPHPAALQDALAVYRSLVDEGAAPSRIAIAGDSAGGGLVFAIVNAIRGAGLPDPGCLVGFSPWTDMTMRGHSLRRNAKRDVMLPVSRMPDVVAWRLGEAGDPTDPSASPALARFSPAPPPALIQASRTEILSDDSQAMAEALRHDGGDVRLEYAPRAPHAYQVFCGAAPEADRAVERAGAFIAARLG